MIRYNDCSADINREADLTGNYFHCICLQYVQYFDTYIVQL